MWIVCSVKLKSCLLKHHRCLPQPSSHSWIILQAPHNCPYKQLHITAAQEHSGEEHIQRIPALPLSHLRGVVEEQPLQGTEVFWGFTASFFVLPHTGLEGLVAATFLVQPCTKG